VVLKRPSPVYSGTKFSWSGTDYNFADWKTNSSQDANSPTPADPLFVNAATDEFHLATGSPAINVGVNLGATYDDGLNKNAAWPSAVNTLDQDDYGAGWEIGAYVYEIISYTEEFYVCATGDGTKPETPVCATAYDAADFNTAGNWDIDDQDDGKIGPNDLVIFLDDGGKYRSTIYAPITGHAANITIQGEAGGTAEITGFDLVTTWTEQTAQGELSSDGKIVVLVVFKD